MPPASVLVICAAAAMLYFGGRAVGHGVKFVAVKTKHVIVHVVHPHKHTTSYGLTYEDKDGWRCVTSSPTPLPTAACQSLEKGKK